MSTESVMTVASPAFRCKVCLMGDVGVGKTSLVNRVTAGIFDDRYLTTVGLRVETMRLRLEEQAVELGLWDMAGGMENRMMVRSGYTGAAAIILVTDPTRNNGLRTALDYARWTHNILPDALLYWVFNKADLRYEWLPENSPEYIRDAPCFITSAKTGEGVEEAFRGMTRGIMTKGLSIG